MNTLITISISLWVVSALFLLSVIYHSYKGEIEKADHEALIGMLFSIAAAIVSLFGRGGF